MMAGQNESDRASGPPLGGNTQRNREERGGKDAEEHTQNGEVENRRDSDGRNWDKTHELEEVGAVNEEEAVLASEDGRDRVVITAQPLRLETVFAFVQSSFCGATSVFVGTTRATSALGTSSGSTSRTCLRASLALADEPFPSSAFCDSSPSSSDNIVNSSPRHQTSKGAISASGSFVPCQNPRTNSPVSDASTSHSSFSQPPGVTSQIHPHLSLPRIAFSSDPHIVDSVHSRASPDSIACRQPSPPSCQLAESQLEKGIVTECPLGKGVELSSSGERGKSSNESEVTDTESNAKDVQRETERQAVEALQGHREGCRNQEQEQPFQREDDEAVYDVVALDLECYTSMAIKGLLAICSTARQSFPQVERIAVSHRKGRVAVGDPALIVCTSSPHRSACMGACSLVVELVKHHLPFWKEEILLKRAKGHDKQTTGNDNSRACRSIDKGDALAHGIRGFNHSSDTIESATKRRRVPGTFLLPLPCVRTSLYPT
ncbi:molybdopterin converting factor, subunit 2 protein [Toxoplasma gondii RUB]|uniref:Molybdopterin converting factor, subunit 2 protein n=1 Tax=Toxoplasma gondii RUB TaxID=935652 RepID=A0A086M580_TOXGO|nr:molybdopterin converting factor, subunit 2 protein [Toxoplasma gondii RUB]